MHHTNTLNLNTINTHYNNLTNLSITCKNFHKSVPRKEKLNPSYYRLKEKNEGI